MAPPAIGEPLLTTMGFAQSNYNDKASNEIVVKLTRVDQDPATQNEAFSLDCAITGGTAVENVDYRLAFNGSMAGLGTVTFAPRAQEKTFTVYTIKNAGPSKTLQIGCSNPEGPAPAVTGEHPVAHITIVNTPQSNAARFAKNARRSKSFRASRCRRLFRCARCRPRARRFAQRRRIVPVSPDVRRDRDG